LFGSLDCEMAQMLSEDADSEKHLWFGQIYGVDRREAYFKTSRAMLLWLL